VALVAEEAVDRPHLHELLVRHSGHVVKELVAAGLAAPDPLQHPRGLVLLQPPQVVGHKPPPVERMALLVVADELV
jgi:hypothetical protein